MSSRLHTHMHARKYIYTHSYAIARGQVVGPSALQLLFDARSGFLIFYFAAPRAEYWNKFHARLTRTPVSDQPVGNKYHTTSSPQIQMSVEGPCGFIYDCGTSSSVRSAVLLRLAWTSTLEMHANFSTILIFRHHWLIPLYTTFDDLDRGRGSKGQQKAKQPACLGLQDQC